MTAVHRPASSGGVSNNLPRERSTFIGREREIARVRSLLAERRLVTLAGVGGSGKTRLALRTVAGELEGFPDGVFFVDIAAITDPKRLAPVFASAIGLTTGGDTERRSVEDVLVEYLTPCSILLLLDNCEHLLDPVAGLVDRLRARCPDVGFCVTSREPLGVEGEHVFRVPALSLPAHGSDARDAEAVRLFIERAGEVREGYAPGAEDLEAIADVCRRLDGIPLAIEFAAARVSHLSPAQIRDRLADVLHMLSGGRRRIERHQTLQATLDWSHDLLAEAERTVFRRLAVFPANFEISAAERVASGPEILPAAVLDLLGSLVAKSLVTTQEGPMGLRYRLLETVRAYALEKLDAAGELEERRSRHRDHYLSWLEEDPTDRNLWSSGRVRRCAIEVDNLRAAAARSIAEDRPDLLGRLAARAAAGFGTTDPLGEAYGWMRRALEEPDRLSPAERLACYAEASLASLIAADGQQVAFADDAIRIAGARPGPWRIAALNARGVGRAKAAALTGTIDPAVFDDFHEAVRLARAEDLHYWVATSLTFFAISLGIGSKQALECLLDAREAMRKESGYEGVEAWVASRLATSLHFHDRNEEALEAALAALEAQSASGSNQFWDQVAADTAPILAAGERRDEAIGNLRSLLQGAPRVRLPLYPNHVLIAVAAVAHIRGISDRASRLLSCARHAGGAAESAFGFRTPESAHFYARYSSLVEAALGSEAAARAMAEGRSTSVEEGTRYALETLDLLVAPAGLEQTGTQSATTGVSPGLLSPDAFRREGDYWSITWRDGTFRLRDLRGLHYIRHLLDHPGREFHAADLARLGREDAGTPSRDVEERVSRSLGDAGTILDSTAKAAYQTRLRDLRHELEEARSFRDIGRVSRLEAEIESLSEMLASAVGLRGRDRRAASATERARVNVTRTIRDAIKRIREHDADLARALSKAIRTGTFCAYEPDLDASGERPP